MIYVPFPDNHEIWWARNGEITGYRTWLIENLGVEGEAWSWRRGDLVAQGVYVHNEEDAVAFKLKFGL